MTARPGAAAVAAVLPLLFLAACAAPAPEPVADEPEPTPTVYPMPEGCPTAEDFGVAFVDDSTFADSIDAALLSAETIPSVPPGGCAYAVGDVGTAESSSETYRRVMVWYFRVGEPGGPDQAGLIDWAVSAGGTPMVGEDIVTGETTVDETGQDFDLPTDFTGWTGADFAMASDGATFFGLDEDPIPQYTQGDQARISFFLYADRVEALVAASGTGTGALDPTTALAQGAAITFQNTINISGPEGYTARVQVQGRLQPFSSYVADSPPGEFRAISSSEVGGTVTNTTAGRNTTSTPVSVIALYPLDTAACTGYNGVSIAGGDWTDSVYCAIGLGGVGAAQLSPDGIQTFELTSKDLRLGDFDESGPALAELNAPVAIYAYFGGRGSGLTGVDWTGDQGCHIQSAAFSGQWVVVMPGWPEVLCV